MMELIDRHSLLKKVYEHPYEREKMTDGEWYRKCIYEAPTIEAEPMRHGHWIWLEPYGALFTHRRKCSECGDIKAQEESNFCPNCGAKMDGGVEYARTD